MAYSIKKFGSRSETYFYNLFKESDDYEEYDDEDEYEDEECDCD